METKKITKEMQDALNAPLPPESISQHPTKKYLSTIKAIYVVERLNQVFGLGGWTQRNEIVEKEHEMKVVHSFLDIPEYGIHLDNFGGNDNADEGDAFKGAATDALTKMASFLGIGMDVYKGLATPSASQTLQDAPGRTETPQRTPSAFKVATVKQKAFIRKLIDERGLPFHDEKWFETLDINFARLKIDELLKTPVNEVFEETMRKVVHDDEMDNDGFRQEQEMDRARENTNAELQREADNENRPDSL